MFAATRSRCGGLAVLVALLCACATASAWAAVPGGYAVQRVDNGSVPAADGHLGSRMANVGDLDEDGKDDVAIGLPAANGGQGEVLVVSGATGAGIYRIGAPTEPSRSGAPAAFGAAVAPFGTVLSCSSSAPGADCGNKQPAGDGPPEFIVGAPGADVQSGVGVDQGRAYVIDGETGAIANRVIIAADDLPLGSQKAEFGYSVLSPGDLDDDGKPDLAVGAPGYAETDTAECELAVCNQAGRVYVYSAADLLSTHATSPVQTPTFTFHNPFALEDMTSQRFGHSLASLADVGSCANQAGGGGTCLTAGPDNMPSNTKDGKPEFLVSAPLLDQGATVDAGAVFVMDGEAVLVIKRINAVEPQGGGRFGSFSYQPPVPSDMVGGPGGDVVVGAPDHGTGRAFVIDGDPTASATPISLTDPSPVGGGGFGLAVTGLDSGGIAVGAPFGTRAGTARLFAPAGRLAQTICDPDGQSGAAFGASIATLGDANGDGFDELAVGAPDFDHPAGANAGRLYILTSKGPAGAGAPEACVSTGGEITGGGGGGDGGDEATPPGDHGDTVVIARVLRRLVLKSSRKRVRKNATIRLRGTLSASGNRSQCQRRQKIALQRRKARGRRFQTFEVALTRATGRFTARAIAKRTYVYRARVSQTARCMGAVSKTAKVSIRRKRGSR